MKKFIKLTNSETIKLIANRFNLSIENASHYLYNSHDCYMLRVVWEEYDKEYNAYLRRLIAKAINESV